MTTLHPRTTRIGVFYDGNYFFHVSNYYLYHHSRQARISLHGFHEFIKGQIAQLEGNDPKKCHVVEAHYFRGRISAREAEARQKLLGERLFEDVLMRENIVTHYLPLSPEGEKGIDVWLALETMELATSKRFDVVVLVAGDGDYACLARKINALGTRVMVTGWDFEYIDDRNETRKTSTSSMLLDQVAYPLMVSSIVDDKSNLHNILVENMFVPTDRDDEPRPQPRARAERRPEPAPVQELESEDDNDPNGNLVPGTPGAVKRGTINNLQSGYGFITTETPGKNLFFVRSEFQGDYSSISRGDPVRYTEGINERGECAKQVSLVEGPAAALPDSV